MSTPRTNAECCGVPLVERLRSVPKGARQWVDETKLHGTRNIPYGVMCHEAADRISQLERELEEARQQLAMATKQIEECVGAMRINSTTHQSQRAALEKAREVILETPHRINKAEAVGEWSALDLNPSAIRNEGNAQNRFFEKHKEALTAINEVLKEDKQ